MIWGNKNDPDSNYPKNYLERLIHSLDSKYKDEKMDANTFKQIVEVQDILELRKNCKISFEKFYQDYKKLLSLETSFHLQDHTI